MKNLYKILIISLLSISTFAQQAFEIDTKFIKLPRYANLSAIQTAIASPTIGVMVYNDDTNTFWYYNGSSWVNQGITFSVPLSITSSSNTLYSETSGNSPTSIGVLGKATFYNPTNFTVGVFGNNMSSNYNGYGVWGKHEGNGIGVKGESDGGAGVLGRSSSGHAGNFSSYSGTAGYFESVNTNTTTTLIANHYGSASAIRANNTSLNNATAYLINNQVNGIALELYGGLKVSGTSRMAFKTVSTVSNIYVNQLIIPNTTLANNENDYVIITHNYGAGATNNFIKPCGVYWEPGTSTWRIYVEDGTAMPVGITFNVLVIKQ